MAVSIALRPVPEPIEVLSVTQDLAEALESLGDGVIGVIEVRVADLEQLREESADHRLSSASVDLLGILIEAARDHERRSGSEYFSIDVWY